MTISTALGLLAALIGSTATLLGAWAYIRAQHPSKQELFGAVLAIIIIMMCIVGLSVFISRATAAIRVNGPETIPSPTAPAPVFPPSSQPTSSPTLTPSPSPTSTPSPSPTLAPSPSPTSTPTTAPALSPTSTSSPVPTATNTSTAP